MAHRHGAVGTAPQADPLRRLVAALAISVVILAVELVGGLLTNSLALLADAGHVFGDVAGIGLAALATWAARRAPNTKRTYGLLRAEILAAALNAVILFGLAGLILLEAVRRLADPPPLADGLMLVVALVGLIGNLLSLALLHPHRRDSLNVRGAYLEVLGDLAGSVAVIVAAGFIIVARVAAADAIASIIIAVLILPRAWSVLREAVDILLEATPRRVDLDEVQGHIRGIPGIADVHDLHAWTVTSGLDVLSAHVVLEPGADSSTILDELCRCLSDDFDIEHSTFQLESPDRRRLEGVSV
ncbi:MAG: cation transporter [Chloroflexi bacterium]|nr:cation transporter [Chloroflexota bacterium]